VLLTLEQRRGLRVDFEKLDDNIKTSVDQLLNHTDEDTKLKSLVLYLVTKNDDDTNLYEVRNGLVFQLFHNDWDFRPSMNKYLRENQDSLPEVPFLIE
jgi:hypothetical protein